MIPVAVTNVRKNKSLLFAFQYSKTPKITAKMKSNIVCPRSIFRFQSTIKHAIASASIPLAGKAQSKEENKAFLFQKYKI